MRLSSRTDYALRLMMRLALQPDTPVTIEAIAAQYRLSRNHLMKIAHDLGKLGYIKTQRGRTGGLRLGCAADSLRIGAFVQAMEPDLALVECLYDKNNNCILTPACRLKGVLVDALRCFMESLDQYTLADLVEKPAELSRILNLNHAAQSSPGQKT